MTMVVSESEGCVGSVEAYFQPTVTRVSSNLVGESGLLGTAVELGAWGETKAFLVADLEVIDSVE